MRLPRLLRWIFSVTGLWLLVMTLLRFVFHWRYNPPGKGFSGSAFLMGLRYDARVVCGLGIFILLLCSLPLLNPMKNYAARRFWRPLLTSLFLLLLTFYVSDYYHYDYLHQRLNASILNYAGDAAISMQMMWQTYPVLQWLLWGIVSMILIWVLMGWLLNRQQQQQGSSKPAISPYLLTVVLFAVLAWGKTGQFPLRWGDAFTLSDDYKANLSLNPIQSFFSTLSFRNTKPDANKVKANYSLMAAKLGLLQTDSSQLNFTRQYGAAASRFQLPNVVLVICESFSAYKSSMYGNPLQTMPFFNSLCEKGVFYDRCFTPAYGTARGVWATITGTPDVQSPKTASRNPGAVDQHTIINDFTGYEKFYFLGGDPSWANIQGLLVNNIGGLHLYSQEDFKAKQVDVWGISDKNLFLEANGILSKQEKPFFAVIQTADNHRPYTIPAEDRAQMVLKNYPDDSLKRYGFESNAELNAFRYTDFCFQQFMIAAGKEKYFNNTLFVFIGDHGIRGSAGNMLPKVFTEEGLTCQHVPLLFYAPQWLPANRIGEVCSQTDVLPSIAGLLGQPYRNTTLGRNLFDSNRAKGGTAFIIDHDEQTIGFATDLYYYRMSQKTGTAVLAPLQNNAPLPAGPYTDSVRRQLATLTTAYYETAKWLLVNNKKR